MFKLSKQSNSRFNVLNARGETVGFINVSNEAEANELIRQWSGAVQSQPQARAQAKASPVSGMVSAMMKRGKGLSPMAVLRGC